MTILGKNEILTLKNINIESDRGNFDGVPRSKICRSLKARYPSDPPNTKTRFSTGVIVCPTRGVLKSPDVTGCDHVDESADGREVVRIEIFEKQCTSDRKHQKNTI
jgi:hypothetical protein